MYCIYAGLNARHAFAPAPIARTMASSGSADALDLDEILSDDAFENLTSLPSLPSSTATLQDYQRVRLCVRICYFINVSYASHSGHKVYAAQKSTAYHCAPRAPCQAP
jgi:hypothetical protein